MVHSPAQTIIKYFCVSLTFVVNLIGDYFFLFQDIGQKLKDQFKSMPDEFMSSPLASKAKVIAITRMS